MTNIDAPVFNDKARTDEQDALAVARVSGFYVRSGQRLAALLAWRAWCRANGVPAIVISRGPQVATIDVDGRKVWSGPNDQAEQQARSLVKPSETRAFQQNLFD